MSAATHHVHHTPRRHAARRRLRRRVMQFLLLVGTVCLAALILKLLFALSNYAPDVSEPTSDEIQRYLQERGK